MLMSCKVPWCCKLPSDFKAMHNLSEDIMRLKVHHALKIMHINSYCWSHWHGYIKLELAVSHELPKEIYDMLRDDTYDS